MLPIIHPINVVLLLKKNREKKVSSFGFTEQYIIHYMLQTLPLQVIYISRSSSLLLRLI
jgi:hypothetical protein